MLVLTRSYINLEALGSVATNQSGTLHAVHTCLKNFSETFSDEHRSAPNLDNQILDREVLKYVEEVFNGGGKDAKVGHWESNQLKFRAVSRKAEQFVGELINL